MSLHPSRAARRSNIAGQFAHPGAVMRNSATWQFFLDMALIGARAVLRWIERADPVRDVTIYNAAEHARDLIQALERACFPRLGDKPIGRPEPKAAPEMACEEAA